MRPSLPPVLIARVARLENLSHSCLDELYQVLTRHVLPLRWERELEAERGGAPGPQGLGGQGGRWRACLCLLLGARSGTLSQPRLCCYG